MNHIISLCLYHPTANQQSLLLKRKKLCCTTQASLTLNDLAHLVFGMSVFNTESVFFVRFLYGSVKKTLSVFKTDQKNGRPREASRGVVSKSTYSANSKYLYHF